MTDEKHQHAGNTVEHGPESKNGRRRDGRFGRGNTYASRQQGKPKGKNRLLREMIRKSIDDAGGQGFIDKIRNESPLELLRIAAKLEPREITTGVEVKQVTMHLFPVEPPADWNPPIDRDEEKHLPGGQTERPNGLVSRA